MRLLEAEAREAGLLPRKQIRDTPVGCEGNRQALRTIS